MFFCLSCFFHVPSFLPCGVVVYEYLSFRVHQATFITYNCFRALLALYLGSNFWGFPLVFYIFLIFTSLSSPNFSFSQASNSFVSFAFSSSKSEITMCLLFYPVLNYLLHLVYYFIVCCLCPVQSAAISFAYFNCSS